jgi:hypothetical protein
VVDENQQYASVSLRGDFDPAEITGRGGLAPSECWRKGDLCPRTRRERRVSRWKLDSRLDRGRGLEDHIRDVLARLDAETTGFAEVAREFGGCMQLVGYFYRDYPGLYFDREITEGLGRLSLAVDFDFYGLDSPRREDT